MNWEFMKKIPRIVEERRDSCRVRFEFQRHRSELIRTLTHINKLVKKEI